MTAKHWRNRESIVKLEVAGERGTAFFVGNDLFLTALHVVAVVPKGGSSPHFREGKIQLTFENKKCEAEVVSEGWSVSDDWVLLRCSERPPVEPFSLHELTESPVNFWTHGYSNRQPIDGMTYDGRVLDHRSLLKGRPVLQLFSDQIAAEHTVENSREYPVGGLSGAPVVVDGSVVGVTRFVLGVKHPQAGTFYATPISKILASDAASLLPPSDPFRGLPPLPLIDPPAQPFRYLAQYQRQHAPVFFGRGWEIRALYDALTAPSIGSPPIIFLTGQSGVGKSSLLTAGLFPRLENEWEVKYYGRRTN